MSSTIFYILYFTASTDLLGRELWQSDGTAAGTKMLSDINVGSGSSSPDDLTNINGVLYFSADDGVNGRELWQSDGSVTGTKIVKDIFAGNESANPSFVIGSVDLIVLLCFGLVFLRRRLFI